MTLDSDLRSFLQQGLSIHLGTRDARRAPNGARVVAVKVEEGKDDEVIAYVPVAGADAVLTDLKANGQAALSFARPADDRACQVKGMYVDSWSAPPSDLDAVQAQWQGFITQLGLVGIPAEASANWVTWPCVAIRIRVNAVFDQTPGPSAGKALINDSAAPRTPSDLGPRRTLDPGPAFAKATAGKPSDPPLSSLASCFQGIIPAMLFTCSADGVPNAAYLSHVEYVDPAHVALSFQFFNKSRRNIAENPQALVHMLDPDSAQGWALRLRYERSETTGPLFDRMALRIEAIASYTGLKGIFKLLAADVYAVTGLSMITADRGHEPDGVPHHRRALPSSIFSLTALQDLSQRINATDSLEDLLDSILAGLEEFFGFRHSMILLAGDEPGTLVTITTRGYGERGAGAEARFGEGIAGVVAEAQKPIRISGLLRGMLYANAVWRRAQEGGLCADRAGVPMPGLPNPDSQLGVPLVVRGELIGVLVIESESAYRFHEEDKATIELLGSYLAIAIQNCQLQDSAESAAESASPASSPAPAAAPAGGGHDLVFHAADEVILVDGEYLIRGLPAKILWKLLTIREREGRAEFTNRELRLDKSLGLPDFKDNLETRLLLLRRRLEQKTPDIRLVPTGRGRFALDVRGVPRLKVASAG